MTDEEIKKSAHKYADSFLSQGRNQERYFMRHDAFVAGARLADQKRYEYAEEYAKAFLAWHRDEGPFGKRYLKSAEELLKDFKESLKK